MDGQWKTVALEEICDFTNGLWKGKNKPFKRVPIYRMTNITKDCELNDCPPIIHEVEIRQLRHRCLLNGDIILEKSGGGPNQPVGRVALFDKEVLGEASFSNFCTRIRVKSSVDNVLPCYLHKFLKFQYLSNKTIDFQSNSTNIRNLNLSQYKKILVPLPSLVEQQRIVTLLDKAFAAIDKAKENAEKNLRNCKELFDSYLNSFFTQRGVSFSQCLLGDEKIIKIIDGDRGRSYPKSKDFSKDGHCLFLNTKNVRPDGFCFDETTFITREKDQALRKGKLQRGDVVMTTRGTIGNLGYYNDLIPYDNIRINSGMLIFRPNSQYILPEYLFEVLRSNVVKLQIKRYVSGAAQPQLPIRTLVNFSIPVPDSLECQKQIVNKAQRLTKYEKDLNECYSLKLEVLNELKKTILQKAFNGELS